MSDQFTVTVAEALDLWDVLESMETKSRIVHISYGYRKKENGHYLFWTGTHRYKSHEDTITVHPEALTRLLCTITLKDFDAEIASLLEKQAKIQQFKRLKAMSPIVDKAIGDELEKSLKDDIEKSMLDGMLNDEW